MSSIDEMSSVDHVLDHLGDVILVLSVKTQDDDVKDSLPQNPESVGSPHATTPGGEPDADVTAEIKTHRYRVSSRHLCLASPVFQTMLEGPWQESPGTNNSPREVKTTDWNPEAMLTLLRIFHGRHKAVLKRLTVEQLCEVAILVDYYKCHEAVELYTDLWVPVLKESCPKEFAQDKSLTFLFVSVVFRVKEVFDTVIKSIIIDAEGPLITHLPISPELIERIDARRVSILDHLFQDLKKLEDKLYEGTACREFDHKDVCNALMLGLLLKGLRILGISVYPVLLHHILDRVCQNLERDFLSYDRQTTFSSVTTGTASLAAAISQCNCMDSYWDYTPSRYHATGRGNGTIHRGVDINRTYQ